MSEGGSAYEAIETHRHREELRSAAARRGALMGW